MAIRSLKNGTFSRSLLIGNDAYIPGDFYSIATVTVGSGGASSISFSSIPSTYTHLQIRGISKTNRGYSGNIVDGFYVSLNSTGATKYHQINGFANGSVGANATEPIYTIQNGSGTTAIATEVFGTQVIDILDYTNTNKNKVTRALWGADGGANTWSGAGMVGMNSVLHTVTSAITSISFTPYLGSLFLQNTKFALYGIKG
jgi:hypothetical protein